MDDITFPCLKIAETISDNSERVKFVLHLAKAIHADEEAVRMFFLIKSLPGNALFTDKEIEQELFDSHFIGYSPPLCTELLKEFPESYSKICCLCKYSASFSNSRLEAEQTLLSALLFNPSSENMRMVLPLKPSNFKASFVFIAGRQLYVYPLYQLFFRFLRGSSTLNIPDNPLIDNLDTPNWQRIIHAFLASTVLKKAMDPHMGVAARDELMISLSNELTRLNPETKVRTELEESMVRELTRRAKYRPLSFSDSSVIHEIKAAPTPPESQKPEPLMAPPLILDEQKTTPALSETGLSKQVLDGLITPLELPKYPKQEEVILPPEPQKIPAIPAETSSETIFIDSDGWYDISAPYAAHQVIPFTADMIRDYLCDSYLRQACCLDCALNQGVPGILIFIPGHGAPAWGTVDKMLFLLNSILSDREITSISWNMPEVIAFCGKHGLTNFSGLHSLTAVYYAATDSAVLFPVDELLSLCQMELDTKSSDFLLHYLPQYPTLYERLLPLAQKKSGSKGIRIWHHYEIALASSIYLQPQFSMQQRNLQRIGLFENEFLYHSKIRKLTKGTVLHVSMIPGTESELLRLQSDKRLIMSILAGLFLIRELTIYGLRLLSLAEQRLTIFVSSKDHHVLACIEELVSQIIARQFQNSHYMPPELIWSK